jgi:hypothetical protein
LHLSQKDEKVREENSRGDEKLREKVSYSPRKSEEMYLMITYLRME